MKTKTINPDVKDFIIGKITRYPGKDSLFLFDTTRMELLQLSPTPPHSTQKHIKLKDLIPLQHIDTLLFNTSTNHLIITDSISMKLFKLQTQWDNNNSISLSNPTDFPLEPGSIITAAAIVEKEYRLLDKGHSMIRILTHDFRETQTIGSRMGYIPEYADEKNQRLGFEFPEDMAVSKDGSRIIVSDSGNKRLVLITAHKQPHPQWKTEKVIHLPQYPFKIIGWDEKDDRIIVSDFDRSLMTISLRHGFVCTEESDEPLNFFPVINYDNYDEETRITYVGSERNEVTELTLPETSLDAIAEKTGNFDVLMKFRMDQDRLDDAHQLVNAHPELLPGYMKYTSNDDDYFNGQLKDYVNQTFTTVTEENETLYETIFTLAHQFMIKYKSLPDSEDIEAANIDKENIRHKMFLKLKRYRNRLNELTELKGIVRNSPPVEQVLKELLAGRFVHIKHELPARLQDIEDYLLNYSELELLKAIIHYWLLAEEEDLVFKERGLKYAKPFGTKFILEILNDFYYNIAHLFFERNKVEQYISFADREITMHPDKISIFNTFNRQLIRLGKYDDVLRMLNKVPDRNKENVNYLYYRVYLGKEDKEKAFSHLKQELALYPHRVNLIPELIELDQLNREETQHYINTLLTKSGQSIDLYFNAAKAFRNIGDYGQAELYVDQELELFPENKHAFLLKAQLFSRHAPGSMDTYYYRKCWDMFKTFIRLNRDEETATRVMAFFSVLNYLETGSENIQDLIALKDSIPDELYKKEFTVYLSFLVHYLKKEANAQWAGKIERFERRAYLSAYSTQQPACDYYLKKAKELSAKGTGEQEKMFELIETILKYNPG
ncbi:MAG: hypothetical protein GY940_13860, partial [bacterium]|nr:hypothetical protein [bacterium]